MKNWNLHSNFSNPKKKTKRINVQSKVVFIKDGTSNVPNPNYSRKTIIMDFFLLVELETKPTTFTTRHWSTITFKIKKSSKKKS
jgi:hypothetical protein